MIFTEGFSLPREEDIESYQTGAEPRESHFETDDTGDAPRPHEAPTIYEDGDSPDSPEIPDPHLDIISHVSFPSAVIEEAGPFAEEQVQPQEKETELELELELEGTDPAEAATAAGNAVPAPPASDEDDIEAIEIEQLEPVGEATEIASAATHSPEQGEGSLPIVISIPEAPPPGDLTTEVAISADDEKEVVGDKGPVQDQTLPVVPASDDSDDKDDPKDIEPVSKEKEGSPVL